MIYTYSELCALFQLSPTSNRMRKRLKLMTDQGFPPPLPGGGRWSKPAVDAWLANWGTAAKLSSPALCAGEGGAHAPDEGPRAPAPATITTLQQTLEQIYH